MTNKEQFKRRSMEFLLKSWNGDRNFYINLREGKTIPIEYMRMSSISTLSQQAIGLSHKMTKSSSTSRDIDFEFSKNLTNLMVKFEMY